MKEIEVAENILGYNFKNKSLIKEALTHASADADKNYQRLEFLGDSLLDFFIAEVFYNKYPSRHEGDLTKLRAAVVQEDSLAGAMRNVGLEQCIIYKNNAFGTSSIADIFESIVAALYLDAGIEISKQFVIKTLNAYIADAENLSSTDFKSLFYEYKSKNKVNIELRTINERGEAHKPVFTVAVYINGEQTHIKAQAGSKKEAERECARIFLKSKTKQ